jgi:hypothetical protein
VQVVATSHSAPDRKDHGQQACCISTAWALTRRAIHTLGSGRCPELHRAALTGPTWVRYRAAHRRRPSVAGPNSRDLALVSEEGEKRYVVVGGRLEARAHRGVACLRLWLKGQHPGPVEVRAGGPATVGESPPRGREDRRRRHRAARQRPAPLREDHRRPEPGLVREPVVLPGQVQLLRERLGMRRGPPRGVRAVRGGSAMTVGPPAVPAGPGRAAPSGLYGYLLATVWGRTPSSSRFSNLRVLHHDRDVVR